MMKALRVRDAASLEAVDRYGADLILLDAHSEKARGGTGERFDWEVAKSRQDVITSSSPGGWARGTCGKQWSSSSPTGLTRRVPWRMGQAGRTVSWCGGSSLRQETEKGYFGPFGGRYVPETLIHALEELEEAYERYKDDPEFGEERDRLARDFVGRPTPFMFAERLTRKWGGANVWFKREDLAHTGAHKINNTLGQILLADRMGKERIIAETGAGQHGVATATVSALYGKECIVYMGEEDTRRQRLNVVRMKLLGAEVVPVFSGSRTLKDAVNEAIRDWVANVEDTHYIIGSVVGPAPYPRIVRDLQSVIGTEIEAQSRERLGGDPDAIVACVGAGSNAIGAFHPFVGRKKVRLVGVEAAGRGLIHRRAWGVSGRRETRRAARGYELRLADGGRPDSRGPLYLGRPRLPGHRSRARVSQGRGPRRVRERNRRGGARCAPDVLASGRNNPGARDGARHLLRREGGQRARAGKEHGHQHLGAWR